MKTSVEKTFTTVAQLPKVKADLKEFKIRYTDSDLNNRFCEAVDYFESLGGVVIIANVEGFSSGDWLEDKTEFRVDMIVESGYKFFKIHFYCDINLTIDAKQHCVGGCKPFYTWEIQTYAREW